MSDVVVVAILKVRRSEIASFRAFETAAARVLREHGASVERTVAAGVNDGGDAFTEIHVVRFPDATAFERYRRSRALAELGALRSAAVISTELFVGEDGPEY